MDARPFWTKQTIEKPLFPDMIWSRPENRAFAGKLLIIGGNLYGFKAPAEAYTYATKAGIGSTRVLLPDALEKTLGKAFDAAEFAPSTPSGSFSQRALGELLPMANWADGVLIADDLGRNSETAILLEKFAKHYTAQLTIAGAATEYFINTPSNILERPDTLLILSFGQLQKLAVAARSTSAFTSDMDLLRFVDILHDFSTSLQLYLITEHLGNVFIAVKGQVSSTRLNGLESGWQTKAAARAATWWLQNPSKPFEALTTSIVAD
ncbi:MAG TPA: hypothetical protein VK983_04155 [Candidatus Limnocylindrales bacterium]|nr:hypothetical protein [Candidatus Limnocylindrales bacterium]